MRLACLKYRHRLKWMQAAKAALVTFGIMFLIHVNFGILINKTASLPYKVFLHFKTWSPAKGGYTVIRRPDYPLPIIKQIKGVGGDHLYYETESQDTAGTLWLNEQPIGIPYQVDSKGKPLTPIPAQIIPQGLVFLGASHPKSFDSRYAEMGLIPVRSLQGLAVPLW
jgi:conjugal transfer pilin signal peptidase TrbI